MRIVLIILWIAGSLAIALVLYLMSAVVTAWVEFKTAPREPMEWCHKHGYFRRQFCLPMAGTLVCPQCYLEAIQNAGKVTLIR